VSLEAADRVLRALLYEGYLLYPYRASSLKNQKRWAFGSLYPSALVSADATRARTECLVRGDAPRVCVAVRFLELAAGAGERPRDRAVERSIDLGELALPLETPCCVDWTSPGDAPGALRLGARVTVSAIRLEPSLHRLAVEVTNTTAAPSGVDRELTALGSVHTLLSCRDAVFVSLLDPPPPLREQASACRNVGTWPVLVGDDDAVMLSSPIILYDRPKIADKSPGDLFDATEIDEILSLRIRTLSEAERREVVATDPHAREIVERTEALDAEGLLALHATCRFDTGLSGELRTARRYGPGDHVVLRPGRGGDVLDLALAGEAATVVGVEEDVEGRVYYTVTVDRDPGRDLGAMGQPGHRFFFTESELEAFP
jgi:hydrogenase maturation protease